PADTTTGRSSDTAKGATARPAPAVRRGVQRQPSSEPVRPAATASRRDTAARAAPSTPPVAQPATPAAQPAAPSAGEPTRSAGRQGYISVSVTPFANISIAGPVSRSRAESRVFADSLPPGRYTVRFERSGYRSETRAVTIRAGVATPVAVTLQPVGQP
ncbi:MAG TPA: PEGA domain-containing protein, partial [Gemmatimonadales bacterium]|nr:PEGA domain-containing protein [Gemmatimonadales bacterium]